MKIRADFVTNSSSESFVIVTIDTLQTMVGAGVGLGLMSATLQAGSEAGEERSGPQAEPETDFGGTPEEALEQKRRELEQELEQYTNQMAQAMATADPTDPRTQEVKQEYEDYLEYIKNQIEHVDYERYTLEVEKAEEAAREEAQQQWVSQRQDDLVQTLEQLSLLQAVRNGYGRSGFDVTDVERQIQSLGQREQELRNVLKQNNAGIDYTAQPRDDIGPDPDLMRMVDRQKAEQQALAEQIRQERNAIRREELERQQAQNERDQAAANASADRWNTATTALEYVQSGADLGVEALSYVTGPAGQKIKLVYGASKELASGIGEATADTKNAALHLSKGVLNAGANLAKDRFGGDKVPYGKWKEAGIDLVNQSLQGGLDAAKDGKDVLSGMASGAGKSALDSSLGAVADKVSLANPLEIDLGKQDAGQFIRNVTQNPLSRAVTRSVGEKMVEDGVKDWVKDSVSGAILGD